MKEKIKKILFIIAEIGVVIWAINGMWQVATGRFAAKLENPKHLVFLQFSLDHPYIPLLFYLFSAVLILYLLRKYERKN